MLGHGLEILYNMIPKPFWVRLFKSPICMCEGPASCIMLMQYSDVF